MSSPSYALEMLVSVHIRIHSHKTCASLFTEHFPHSMLRRAHSTPTIRKYLLTGEDTMHGLRPELL